ncbi:helix-turn-helix transcriptional regulator [Paenibacillus sp. FSL L8-0494]|uniref:helix-turn-helix transcriptional regulator n=1 Tax=Paenibacillus sp. FSL L8-0494 TaxID=2975352 RepID=UPI0030FA9B3D
MNRNDYPLILQIKDVQQILGFSKSTAYEIAKTPDFPLIQINKRKIVYRDEFFSWLDSKKEQAVAFN